MYVKIHKSEHTEIVAACDESLLGKKIRDGDLELHITKEFYKGDLKSKEEVIKLLKSAQSANLIGEESVSAGIEAKIISEESIATVGGVKHAQFYTV